MSDVDIRELEATVLNALSIVFDAMLDSKTVPTAFLTQSLEHVAKGAMAKGQAQSAGHMLFLRDFVAERSVQRETARSLLQEPPKGKA